MLYFRTDPESYITKYALLYDKKKRFVTRYVVQRIGAPSRKLRRGL